MGLRFWDQKIKLHHAQRLVLPGYKLLVTNEAYDLDKFVAEIVGENWKAIRGCIPESSTNMNAIETSSKTSYHAGIDIGMAKVTGTCWRKRVDDSSEIFPAEWTLDRTPMGQMIDSGYFKRKKSVNQILNIWDIWGTEFYE